MTEQTLLERAQAWQKAFRAPELSDTLYAKQLLPLIDWVASIERPISWGMRLKILWTGKIPEDVHDR